MKVNFTTMRRTGQYKRTFYFMAAIMALAGGTLIFFLAGGTKPSLSGQLPQSAPRQPVSAPALLAATDEPASARPQPASGPAGVEYPTDIDRHQSVVMIPTLTLGKPPINPYPGKSNPSAKLRWRYQTAVQNGTWPTPTATAPPPNTGKEQPLKSTPARVPKTTAMRTAATYTVKSGQSLSKIAQIHYGDPDKWPVIYEANRKSIGPNPNRLRLGQQLVIPKLQR